MGRSIFRCLVWNVVIFKPQKRYQPHDECETGEQGARKRNKVWISSLSREIKGRDEVIVEQRRRVFLRHDEHSFSVLFIVRWRDQWNIDTYRSIISDYNLANRCEMWANHLSAPFRNKCNIQFYNKIPSGRFTARVP